MGWTRADTRRARGTVLATAVTVWVGSVATVTTARAQPSWGAPPRPAVQPWWPTLGPGRAPAPGLFGFVSGQLGLGTPVGAAGLEAGLGWGWVRASVGVGAGLNGRQLATMVRVAKPSPGLEVGLGVGVSHGPALTDFELSLGESSTDDPVDLVNHGSATVWASVELGLDYPLTPTLSARLAIGLSHAVERDCRVQLGGEGPTGPCSTTAHLDKLHDLPYLGLAAVWRP